MSTTTTALTIVPRTVDEFNDLAERFAKSSLLPKSMQGKAPDVLVTIMAGAEMGLSPMASLRAIHVIEGKPVLSADGMVALVLGSGKAKYFTRVAESDTSVTYETCRVGTDTPRQCTWTLAQAKAAALEKKDNWRMYPRAMLASRAKAELARDVYPDVLMGCYTEDEIERSSPIGVSLPTPSPANDVTDAEVVSDEPAPPEIAQLEAATTRAEVKALASKLADLAEPWKTQARERYSARLKEIAA
jgi:hypothetical protein